ncbi:MAG: small basic family protein [Candidatus Peregrinibacteria bacterium]|nr:small basic family protein [Candidatus Peregrinibacteria bacterium]MDZ4244533.1 small basic family protein [Candidatus Gracilibacteria bacterium]
MIWSLIGILLGIIIGLSMDIDIPIELTRYTAVIIIGMLDALFGAIRAEFTKDDYDPLIFLTGLFFNTVLAVGITYLGDRLGLDLYLAATVVFTFRIFSNVGIVRRVMIEKWISEKTVKTNKK